MKSISKIKGFTLVEIGIVLLIAAAIVFAAVRLGGGKSDETKANTEGQIIADLITSTQKATQAGATLTGNTEVIAAKILPASWTSSGTTITHGFGGGATFALTAPMMKLTLAGISQIGCQNLAPIIGNNPAVDTLLIGPTGTPVSVKATGAAPVYATIATQCATASPVIEINYRTK